MVGNTHPYSINDWTDDIMLAHASGIDGFALNCGADEWGRVRVADAYEAAKRSGLDFKLFISLDMTSLQCGSPDDASRLRELVEPYLNHPNQLQYDSRTFVSTFSGETCTFGQANVVEGWKSQFVNHADLQGKIYFVPAFFIDPEKFSDFSEVIDGDFNWNSGWPIQITTSFVKNLVSSPNPANITNPVPDAAARIAMQARDGESKKPVYMGAVSPWFFTHYGQDSFNKNWIFLSDQHLYAKRWESIIASRDQFDVIQVLTWNDYGESHYIGPIKGAQPNSESWVDGFNHTGWLTLTKYYATAYKSGVFPAIEKDQILMWSRPHPAEAKVNDPVGQPDNFELVCTRVHKPMASF
ncbi:Glucan endo-1,3-alpha-glucosidase agn1 [Leucoagaricus sp. SymC.cos]|nr:Glucan endo-1,3-alpha-glucosidase agn1 [Leucoagaricus sp. SymC.cos]